MGDAGFAQNAELRARLQLTEKAESTLREKLERERRQHLDDVERERAERLEAQRRVDQLAQEQARLEEERSRVQEETSKLRESSRRSGPRGSGGGCSVGERRKSARTAVEGAEGRERPYPEGA